MIKEFFRSYDCEVVLGRSWADLPKWAQDELEPIHDAYKQAQEAWVEAMKKVYPRLPQ